MLPVLHLGDHFADHAYQHIEHEETCHKYVNQEQEHQDDATVSMNLISLHPHRVKERAVHQQKQHGVRHGGEILLLEEAAWIHQASEKYAENVYDDHQKAHCDAHGPNGSRDPPQQRHHRRHRLQQTVHARETQQPSDAQDREVALERASALVTRQKAHERKQPEVQPHRQHQRAVEAEPPVAQAEHLPPVGRKANDELDGEEAAEYVVHHLEPDLGRRPVVVVQLYGDPYRVQGNHEGCDAMEELAPGDGRGEACRVVEVLRQVELRANSANTSLLNQLLTRF
mmetsp:Transcript_30095/g.85994  ORF Transcript_30095/g.85994 Transcript_30095/m.85994 type:complete len:284 (+) Transcript_30095:178-1029(+)